MIQVSSCLHYICINRYLQKNQFVKIKKNNNKKKMFNQIYYNITKAERGRRIFDQKAFTQIHLYKRKKKLQKQPQRKKFYHTRRKDQKSQRTFKLRNAILGTKSISQQYASLKLRNTLNKKLFYLVLPFEFRPHCSELIVGTRCRNNIIHNVNMDIVQNHTVSVSATTAHVVNNITKDDAILCRRYFYTCLNDK